MIKSETRIGKEPPEDNSIKLEKNPFLSDILADLFSNIINPYIYQIKKIGLKKYIEKNLTGSGIDQLFLNQIRNRLSSSRNIKLGSGLGRASIQYRNNKIQINLTGAAAFVISEITITDNQLIAAIDDVIDQFQYKYIDDLSYLILKIEEVLTNLSNAGIYRPKTSEEKTLYDLVLLMLIRKYKYQSTSPRWLKVAIDKLERPCIIKDLIISIVDQVSSIAENISQNLYLNLRLTLDSGLLRITLNKKTNNGQIAGFFNLFGIDINQEIDALAKEYMTPSFVKGMGEILVEIMNGIFYNTADSSDENSLEHQDEIISNNPFQITMTQGSDPITSRSFRWFTEKNIKGGVIQYSKSKDFKDPITIKAKHEEILKPKTIFSLGLLSIHKTKKESKYSVELKNLKEGTPYWYRVGNYETDSFSDIFLFEIPPKNEVLTFLNVADSQGMVKSDYDTFLNAFNAATENIKNIDFVSHLGDFVDDGNNEDYWDFLLNHDIWKKYPILPLAGNHEARVKKTILDHGGENSILCHFNINNISNIPKQNTSTGAYYSFECKNTRFVVLNTNDTNEDSTLNSDQYDWAIKTAKASKAKWKILFTHKPPYSNGPHCDDHDVKKIKTQLEEICERGGFDLVLSGHDHVYVRTPILLNSKKTKHQIKIIEYENIKYHTAVDPVGSLFIVPGTSGVKNYRQDLSSVIPSELIHPARFPVYSKIVVDKNNLYFTAYKYDLKTGESSVFDCYAIEKNEGGMVKKNKDNFKNNLIKKSSKAIVKNRTQFITAIKNPKVSTIITSGKDLNLGSIFGCKKICIDRDLEIKGSSRLIHVSFNVKNCATLIINDQVFIDNARKQKSIYPAITAIKVYDNSKFILRGQSLIKSEYGSGKDSRAVNLIGNYSQALFQSSSEQWSENGVVYSENKTSKVTLASGKFSSRTRYPSIESNGEIVVNDSNVKNINVLKDGRLYFKSGTIGNQDAKSSFIPLKINGSAYITGGTIYKKQNKAIVLDGNFAKLYLAPVHKGAINIADTFPFANLEIQKNNIDVELYGTKNNNNEINTIYASNNHIWDIAETLYDNDCHEVFGTIFNKPSYFAKIDCSKYFNKIISKGKSKVYLISSIKHIY